MASIRTRSSSSRTPYRTPVRCARDLARGWCSSGGWRRTRGSRICCGPGIRRSGRWS
jgi:hypothetical protein